MNGKLYRKIVVLDSVIFFPEHRRRLEAMADEIVEYNTCRSEEEVLERCQGADCIISCWVDVPRRVLEANPQLRTVAFWTHDYEHRIDAPFARDRGVYVPAIPDYGTDSVAELVLIALLQRCQTGYRGQPTEEHTAESIAAAITDQVRGFNRNVKDTLYGRWLHEYIKTGQRLLTHPDEIPEETMKGLTVGVLEPRAVDGRLVSILADGFRSNLIYSLYDRPHSLDLKFRPVDHLLAESQVIVYDSRTLPAEHLAQVEGGSYLAKVDLAGLNPVRRSLVGRRLGIVGLGRIGSRVAQIAREGFGMDVQYYTRTPKPEYAERYGLRAASLEQVLTSSDVVSFHLPHHGADGFVSDDLVQLIPDGTTVVNASVGNVIDDEPMFLKRFATGEIEGYLDVYRTLPPRQELRAMRASLTATYRLGWRTKSTVGLKTHKLLTKIESVDSADRPER